ncbi:CHAT domain-containing protein [Kitasatospora cineracea]|uniref:CHAT domain-containing protein n=1 Tax=Kitasatospora cineracea TaxID=88074 RepID=UPI00344685C1
MDGQTDGGMRGVRVWAADAQERVKRLLPVLRGGPAPLADWDASIIELEQLARLLDHEPVLRSATEMWLGVALAMRQEAGGGTRADRERAERLLRQVRDRDTELGATASEEHRKWAALGLIGLLSPLGPQEGFRDVPDLSAFLAWAERAGPAGVAGVATEIQELSAEVADLPLPPDFVAHLKRFRQVTEAPTPAGIAEMLEGMLPPGNPFADQLRQMLGGFLGGAASRTTPPTDPPNDDLPRHVQSDPAPGPPVGPTREDLHRMVAGLDAVNAAGAGLLEALDSPDPHQGINALLGRLRAVQDDPPPGVDPTQYLEGLRAVLLGVGGAAGGTFRDREAGRGSAAAVQEAMERVRHHLPPGVGDPRVLVRLLELSGEIMATAERGNVDAAGVAELRRLTAEAEQLAADVPDGMFRGMVVLTLGAARAKLGLATGDRELARDGLAEFDAARSAPGALGPLFGNAVPVPAFPGLDALRAALSDDPVTAMEAALAEHASPSEQASTDEVHAAALALGVAYGVTRERAVLDRLIGELERVRDGVRRGRAPRIAAEALWRLAEAYRARAVEDEDVSDVRALTAAREALTALAADVLMQEGAEHGLAAARAAAGRGVQAALWAASQGRPHEAVTALELGRALVLHAASTSATVPELLERRGHAELAADWRAAAVGGDRPGDGVPAELPSTLRRRALDALGYRQQDGLLGAPTPAELSDGLAECGADALIYLIPGDAVSPGVLLAVAPRLGIRAGVEPLLSQVGSAPLERYLDAAAAYGAVVGGPAPRPAGADDSELRQTWEDALTSLCDWAGRVLWPLADGLEEGLGTAGRPLRLVLVPCGRLGLVPWHAARHPEAGHLVRRAVVSYAASGGQFLRTLRLAPRPPAAAPVLIADPTYTLEYAEDEVLALRRSFYPDARVCGDVPRMAESEVSPNTPEAVLGYLADGLSLLHVAAHGSAGTSPTASGLRLPAPAGPRERPADWLTVTRLLDRPGPPADREDGPLVVLSACQTDLSTRDHDEALTVTTGFVTAGARDVIGSRWVASDSATAVLMAVFHHYLNEDRLSPAEALRAAQLWMLDPQRSNPGSLHGDLLRAAARPDLDRTAYWAAFIHQGHPGPGAANDGTTSERRTG